MTHHPDKVAVGLDRFLDEAIALRRDLHVHPELGYNEHRTSQIVADKLSSWGYDVATGIGGTGVVGTLQNGKGPKRLGIRADMDALPITETTGLSYASGTPGQMHACGHDGHTTILLNSARYLADTRDFTGTLNLIFQPAEEGGAGARRMIRDGLFERFPCDAVFGLHNWPGVATGQFGFIAGPAMASVDKVTIRIVGKGGHGARPQETVDPVVASASLIMALQSIVARNIDPLDAAVITVGTIHAGIAPNVIPDSVELELTVRTFRADVRETIKQRITNLAKAQAESYGATAEIDYPRGYPVLVNHSNETEFARQVAVTHFGEERVENNFRPISASEDFAFMLEELPGSYLFIGNGDSAPLHSPLYDFNDEIIAPASRYWVKLAEEYLAKNPS
ncbi:M20 aminoacylase family protein [Phyllobacterium zundukense]|uniref:Amidohydrolase n=1 Tax=Phyllobacterium zundukense TaxID=1867719 RepID=A0A2N9VYQ9_9HYPH|nr:M20 aminoacylase family protein [Phyllobacterium zundukense]ATU95211.1 amidohydrolase [Phyllobacterium zundukense]PIO44627.1 amidohydrolase [Phyllobacterium zundukense]